MLLVIMFDWKQSSGKISTRRKRKIMKKGETTEEREKLSKIGENRAESFFYVETSDEQKRHKKAFILGENYSSNRAEVVWVWYPAARRLISEYLKLKRLKLWEGKKPSQREINCYINFLKRFLSYRFHLSSSLSSFTCKY